MSQCDVFFSAAFRTREEPVRRHPCPPAEATTRGRERYEFQNRFACCRPRHWHGSFCTSVHRHPHWPDLLRCLLLTKADISQVMDNLPRSVRALSRSLLLICQLIQSFRRLGLGFGGLPVYGLKRALDADVASRQHRFRNRKKLTNKVEVRIVRHGLVTLSPR